MKAMMSSDRKTVVNKELLLSKLRDNFVKHMSDYNEAVAGYKEEALTKLDVGLEKAKKNIQSAFDRAVLEIQDFDPEGARDYISFCEAITFNLVAPKKFSDAYEQAISMLEWEERKEIELSSYEFRCFVMDKWDWQEEFTTSNIRYLKKKSL